MPGVVLKTSVSCWSNCWRRNISSSLLLVFLLRWPTPYLHLRFPDRTTTVCDREKTGLKSLFLARMAKSNLVHIMHENFHRLHKDLASGLSFYGLCLLGVLQVNSFKIRFGLWCYKEPLYLVPLLFPSNWTAFDPFSFRVSLTSSTYKWRQTWTCSFSSTLESMIWFVVDLHIFLMCPTLPSR